MSKLMFSDLPEYLEFGRSIGFGLASEERAFKKVLQRVEREGDTEDLRCALFLLFSTYCRYRERTKALRTLHRMEKVEGIDKRAALRDYGHCILVANELLLKLGDYELAHDYVKDGLQNLGRKPRSRRKTLAWQRLKNIELAVLAHRDPKGSEVDVVLTEIESTISQSTVYDEALLCALEVLVSAGGRCEKIKRILEATRGKLQAATRENAEGYSVEMNNVESLLSIVESSGSRGGKDMVNELPISNGP